MLLWAAHFPRIADDALAALLGKGRQPRLGEAALVRRG
jgi:hypothetical protein